MISLSVGGLDMKIRFAFLLLIVGLIATVSSCSKRSLNALNPCTINGVVQNVPVNPQRALLTWRSPASPRSCFTTS